MSCFVAVKPLSVKKHKLVCFLSEGDSGENFRAVMKCLKFILITGHIQDLFKVFANVLSHNVLSHRKYSSLKEQYVFV